MTKAEAFKQKFDQDVPLGTSYQEVASYLKTQNLQFGLRAREPIGTGDEYVELLREKSPERFCGNGSVGIKVHFTDNKLDRAETTFWSFDCP
jgi:hypothetical protein